MLVVTVAYRPRGDAARDTVVASATIVNVGTGTRELGKYLARFWWRGAGAEPWRRCRVEGFPRLRLSPWALLFRALTLAIGADDADETISAAAAEEEAHGCDPTN